MAKGFMAIAEREEELRDTDKTGPSPPPDKEENDAAVRMIMLALKALSQRAIIAIANLFSLVTVISAWWVWISIPSPDTHQLIALGIYAAFILAINFIVRRA